MDTIAHELIYSPPAWKWQTGLGPAEGSAAAMIGGASRKSAKSPSQVRGRSRRNSSRSVGQGEPARLRFLSTFGEPESGVLLGGSGAKLAPGSRRRHSRTTWSAFSPPMRWRRRMRAYSRISLPRTSRSTPWRRRSQRVIKSRSRPATIPSSKRSAAPIRTPRTSPKACEGSPECLGLTRSAPSIRQVVRRALHRLDPAQTPGKKLRRSEVAGCPGSLIP